MKWMSQRGETLVETLVSMLIVALASLMLAGAVVSAAKVNSRVKNEDVFFSIFSNSSSSDGSSDYWVNVAVTGVELPDPASNSQDYSIVLYDTGKGFCYYEPSY